MSILKRPHITEQANALMAQGVYTFIVDKKANKIEIRKAVEKMYSVKVESVNTINVLGKPKVKYYRSRFVAGHKPSYKKALVKIKAGDTIEIFGGNDEQ